jgi:hypothetical protein
MFSIVAVGMNTGCSAGVSGSGGSTGSHGTATGKTGGGPSPQCLNGINCVSNADCPSGYHCNTTLMPPQCEKLYCGDTGTTCSEDANCQQQFACDHNSCVTPSCPAHNGGTASCLWGVGYECTEAYSSSGAAELQVSCEKFAGAFSYMPCAAAGAVELCGYPNNGEVFTSYHYMAQTNANDACQQEGGQFCVL